MRILAILIVVSGWLAACANPAVRRPDQARFDLGPAIIGPPLAVGVVAVTMEAPSWLAGSAMQYRLAYAEPVRRREFADSRWAAPPYPAVRPVLTSSSTSRAPCSSHSRRTPAR